MARKEFAVFGLGEFGRSVALTLAKNGCEVMAIDSSSEKVQEIADSVTHAVKADATDMDVVLSLIHIFQTGRFGNTAADLCAGSAVFYF